MGVLPRSSGCYELGQKYAVGGMRTRKHVVREKEKQQFGEVFTPEPIIDEMLASLPSFVWSNPDLAWLDPSCGYGNFPMKIIHGGKGYPGLFQGLSSVLPNVEKRKLHILSMLTCYDINKKSIAIFRQTLAAFCKGLPKLYAADFLTEPISERFDIVVTNPPYNAGGTKRVGEKRLHIRFAEKSLGLLHEGGRLLFVCPPNYRQAGSTMNALFLNKGCFEYIRILGPEETLKIFHIQSRVDIFLFHLGRKGKTFIVDEYGFKSRLLLDFGRHIPNFGHSIFDKIRQIGIAKIDAFRTAEGTTIGCKNFGSGFPTIHLIVAEGRRVLRRRKHSLYGVPKLLLNGLGVPYVFHDVDGSYGVTQTPVVVARPSAALVAFTQKKLFYFLVWALRLTGNNNLPYVFSEIPADFGAGLRLTTAEQSLVDSFRLPVYANKDLPTICGSAKAV
jgi:hypothetical protein